MAIEPQSTSGTDNDRCASANRKASNSIPTAEPVPPQKTSLPTGTNPTQAMPTPAAPSPKNVLPPPKQVASLAVLTAKPKATLVTAPARDTFLDSTLGKAPTCSDEAMNGVMTAPDASTFDSVVVDEEPEIDLGWKVLTTAPAWLLSTVVHLVCLVLLGILFFGADVRRDFEVEMVFGTPSEDPVESLDVSVGTDDTDQPEVLTTDTPDVEVVPEPDVAPPEIVVVEEQGTVEPSPRTAPSIGNALSGREPGRIDELAAKGGGGAATQGAVGLGLKWLKRNQRAAGNWSLRGPYRNGAQIENEVAATSMAMLAFQGAGNTHKHGKYKRAVRRGMDFLIKRLDSEGDFCRGIDRHQRLYTQAQATIVLCELYGMSKDERLRGIAQSTIDYAVRIQDSLGGWRYQPGSDTDTSVTGWFVMALKSAEMSGLEVPTHVYENISRYLDVVASYDGSRYAYRPGREFTEAMTAEALLCRQYLGWTREDGRLRDGVHYLLMHPINYRDENSYYWYYATQVMHNMGGEEWHKWNAVMKEKLPNKQTKTGRDAGSWVPNNDRWGVHAGRLYTTCLSIYMLEVYYRHLPVYGGVAEAPIASE